MGRYFLNYNTELERSSKIYFCVPERHRRAVELKHMVVFVEIAKSGNAACCVRAAPCSLGVPLGVRAQLAQLRWRSAGGSDNGALRVCSQSDSGARPRNSPARRSVCGW